MSTLCNEEGVSGQQGSQGSRTIGSLHARSYKKGRKMATKNKTLAQKGHEAAVKFLQSREYEILDENLKFEDGTIDIVAKDDGNIVFVQVSVRDSSSKGLPSEAMSNSKRMRLERMAIEYLKDNAADFRGGIRFDTIGIVVVGDDRAFIRHHINAMTLGESTEDNGVYTDISSTTCSGDMPTHQEVDSLEKLRDDIDCYMRDCALDTDTIDEFERRFTALIERR